MKSYQIRHSSATKGISSFRKSKRAKGLATVLMLSLLYEIAFPNICLALTSGPATPEFSSFEPVATTNMVNEFSGQFVYNIPVLEIPGASGGGYALSLSYHSGDGPESEASWVGYGWNLNPGSINRTKRGLPDDVKGAEVVYHNDVPKNWTISATGQAGLEAFSVLGTVNATARYNNYKGFGYSAGVGLAVLKGTFSLGYSITDGNGAFSVGISPASILSAISALATTNQQKSGSKANRETMKVAVAGPGQVMRRSVSNFVTRASAAGATSYINYLLADLSSPYYVTPFKGTSITGAFNVTGDPFPVPIGGSLGFIASYNEQKNLSPRTVKTYGYMYSGDALSNKDASNECMMDYVVEKPSSFNKRDKYLPVPYSAPDAFFVSGEGVSGSFRFYNDRIGIFSPNFVESETSNNIVGADYHAGQDWGVGADLLLDGSQKLVQASWWTEGNGNTDDYLFEKFTPDTTVSEPGFFRFNNDLGGKVVYDPSNVAFKATIAGKQPMLSGDLSIIKDGVVPGDNRRNARASYIGYHTNAEMKKNTSFGKRGTSYEQRESIHTQAGRDLAGNNNIKDMIGEVSVNNEDGNNYLYGLPVYCSNEKSMQHGIINITSNENNFWTRADISGKYKVGEEYQIPYVTSYLLTQITTPDYIDINLNGPDAADFGGYTSFSYKRVYGDDNKNNGTKGYKWRGPFNGVYYNPQRLSDISDNTGSYQSGYKEIYYVDTIQTKTHYAKFYTSARLDGKSALTDDLIASTAIGTAAIGSQTQQKLDSIVLFAKATIVGQTDQKIKKINFQYDYTTWPNTDNSSATGRGRLTLKKVWFDYNGTLNAKVSPYVFHYQYPTSADVNYPAKYSALLNYSSTMIQTPRYDTAGRYIDCWGDYMFSGRRRREDLQSWVDQTPSNQFDPAAWQLKRIVLPSGGEIHVQYEQNAYAYVQDRSACAMVKLKSTSGYNFATGNEFILDLSELDIPSSDYPRLRDLIEDTYIGQDKKYTLSFCIRSLQMETLQRT